MTELWYLAYGSNLQARLLARYLEEPPRARESHWLQLERSLYFAGESRKWSGAVAFLSLSTTADRAMFTTCLAVAVTRPELEEVFRCENGLGVTLGAVTDDLDVEDWAEVPMRRPQDHRLGKYNAVLRGPDLEGRPSFTFSTARRLALGAPAPDYAAAIADGLAARDGVAPTSEYLGLRTRDLTGDNERYLAAGSAAMPWSTTRPSTARSSHE